MSDGEPQIIEQELNFEEFVDDFYSRSIGEPKCISNVLRIDCESPQKIFEMMLVLFTTGLRHAYGGTGVVLSEIPAHKINQLIQRFAMLGVKPVIETCAAPRVYSIDNSQYQTVSALKDMIFTLEQEGIMYRIHFELF